MSAKYISSNWRLLNQENSSKSDNYGLTFDGSNEYISTTLTQSGTLSVSCWFYTDDASTQMAFFGAGTTNPYQIRNFGLQNGEYVVGVYTKDLTPNFRGIRYDTTAGSASYTTGQWTHFVGIIEKVTSTNANYYLYENGVLKVQTNDGYREQTTYPFFLGAMNNFGTATQKFNGKISEVAVFDYVLSSTQISTLYGSSELGSTSPMALKPQPISYYPLGDNSASNPLTQPNEAVEDASVFEFVSSSSQYIDCGIPSFLNSTSVFTSSLWFNTNDVGTQTTLWANGSSASQLWVISKFEDDLIIYGGTSTKYYRKNNLFSINTWYNLIVVYDGSQANADRFKVYLNGVLLTGATINGTIETITPTFTTNLNIGRIGYAAASYFNGEISNVVFWNSDQSSEISNIYNSGVPATSYTNTPSAWYKLDQSANWEADSSGAWQIPDAVSAYPQSFDFDNDYIDCGTSNAIASASSFAVSAWVKIDTGGVFFSSGTSNTDRVFFSIDSSNVYFGVKTGSGGVISWANSFTNTWYHIVGVVDAGTSYLYVNGIQRATGSVSTLSSTAGNNVKIGNTTSPMTSAPFYGKISNVQVFNSALPATGTDSVETLYNNGSPLTTAIASDNLKLWSKLDNTATFSTNWSIPDASGNGNTGTSSGMTEQNLVNNNVSALNGESSGMTSASLVLSDLTRAVPYDSYSFNFDSASSDYIDCGNDTSLNWGTGNGSVSCWFKTTQNVVSVADLVINGGFSTGGKAYILYLDSSEKVGFALDDNSSPTTPAQSSGSVADGNWHHVVGVRESGNIKLYLDGSLVSTQTDTTGNIDSTDPLIIGAGMNASTGVVGNFYDGKISNVSIFNEALTSTEVLKLYSNGVPQNLENFNPQPVAFYPLGSNSFWNGSAWTVRDMSTGGLNDGTGVNLGQDALVGDSPRSTAGGTGTNMDVPSNLEGSTKWSDNNSWSINMSETARVEDTP